MKLVRYGNPGKEKPGLIDADGKLRDLSAWCPTSARRSWARPSGQASARPTGQAAAGARQAAHGLPGRQRRQVHRHRPELRDHAAESGMPIPKEPVVFMKATSCIQGPDDDVMLPKGSVKTDWEVELGMVIGTRARYVSKKGAGVRGRLRVSTTSASASTSSSAARSGTRARAATPSAPSAPGW
jgi:2,4-diketo-3-deoxy-L-fuconate hydrolase